jgi:ubiquinone/menaquinone biosynthesis C-methylase UbiE
MMAEAFPNSEFVGFDFHEASIREARKHAKEHGMTGNVRFEVSAAKTFPGKDYDLVTFFDCLHDMGDPAGAAQHVRQALKSDGTWMIVEPFAHDALEDNINPVGRLYYAASTWSAYRLRSIRKLARRLARRPGHSACVKSWSTAVVSAASGAPRRHRSI